MKKEHIVIWTLFLFLMFVFCVEMTSRWLYKDVTLEAGRKSVEVLLGNADIYNYSSFTPHPYMLYENTPLYTNSYQQINSLGYRGHEISETPDKKTIRILTLGGSTTFDGGVENPAKTWTAQLEGIFNHKGYKVETINGGINAATSAEMLSHYMFKYRYLSPDVVIVNLGWNDTAPLYFKDYDPTYSKFRRWGGLSIASRVGEKEILQYSYFLRIIYAWWLGNPKLSDLILLPAEWNTVKPSMIMQNVKHNEPIGFERNLGVLLQTIITDGAKPVLFIEPIATADIFKTYHDDWVKSAFSAMEIAYEKDKAVVRKMSKKYHVFLIEMPKSSIPISDFVDHAHVNEAGAALKANFIYQNLPKNYLRKKYAS
ncbi:MAG TPA: hypothetical protein VJ279_04690 [Hanamia sp.]|jgi:hypothetical protein|nr:hypothetical protein [Hanamia sp.]